jgi:hypothetical protein
MGKRARVVPLILEIRDLVATAPSRSTLMQLSSGLPGGTVNPSRKLARFESWTRHQ